MSSDVPSSAAVEHVRRDPGLFGLPKKLALTAAGCVFACTLLLAVFADRQLSNSADSQAKSEALTIARAASSEFGPTDFSGEEFSPRVVLEQRLHSLQKLHRQLAGETMYAIGRRNELTEAASIEGGSRVDSSNRALRRAANGSDPTFEDATVEGRHVLRVYYPISEIDARDNMGVVSFAYDRAHVDNELSRSRTQLFLGALASGSTLILLLLTFLQRELFRPLLAMRQVMTQIRNGATGVRIGWHRCDELGAVADEFDSMVEELEAAHRELAGYVNRDPLTGLLNRQAFVDRLSAEFTRARREGYPVTLVALDVDDLDGINARHDRKTGDAVLRLVGEAIGMGVRPTDICGRVGGDDFLIALIGARADQAAGVLQRLHREIAVRVAIGPYREGVTTSMGLAEFPEHASDQVQVERFAQSALVHAQKSGADRCAIYGRAGEYVFIEDVASATGKNDVVSDEDPSAAREGSSRPAAAAVNSDATDLVATVHALARAIDGRGESSEHSQRVARIAVALARAYGFADARVQRLRSAAVLHDIGKIGVPTAVVSSTEGERTGRERAILQSHAHIARSLLTLAGMDDIASWVYHQPEQWDGSGYPDGLSGEDIPLESRILHAANALDRINADGNDAEAAANQLLIAAGSKFDPVVAERLAELVRAGLISPAGDGVEADFDAA